MKIGRFSAPPCSSRRISINYVATLRLFTDRQANSYRSTCRYGVDKFSETNLSEVLHVKDDAFRVRSKVAAARNFPSCA